MTGALSPEASPEGQYGAQVIPPPISPPIGDGLQRITLLATGGGTDRRMTMEVESKQTVAELCVQAHPALVMSGHPVTFLVVVGGGVSVNSATDGHRTLGELQIRDGSVVDVHAQLAPLSQPQPQPQPQPAAASPAPAAAAAPSPAAADVAPTFEELPPPSPAQVAPVQTTQSPRHSSLYEPRQPSERKNRKKFVTINVMSKERRTTKSHVWDLSLGEKLLSICKRCNLTEPHVPARNNTYKGFIVSAPSGVYSTKQHGRMSVRELKFEDGDNISVEVDWEGVNGPSQGRKKSVPPKAASVPHQLNVPAVSDEVLTAPAADYGKIVESPEVSVRPRAIPAPLPVVVDDIDVNRHLIEASLSPLRQSVLQSPPPVSPLPLPAEIPLMPQSPAPVQVSPRTVRGIEEEVAWVAFVEALSSVLHEQDLLLVSADTVRGLIAHYGFDKDPIIAAKIELHWKRKSGKVPKSKPNLVKDPRHTKHIDTVFPNGRPDRRHHAQGKKDVQPSRGGRVLEQRTSSKKSLKSSKGYSSLPFGGGAGETPCIGPVGRRLEQEPSIGRRRAVSPTSTQRDHLTERRQHFINKRPATSDPNTAVENTPETASFQIPENCDGGDAQGLAASGRRQHMKNMQSQSTEVLGMCATTKNGYVPSGSRARVQQLHTDNITGCDPNRIPSADSSRRGRSTLHTPDAAAANSNPNACGKPVTPSTNKCYSIGPKNTAACANPNALATVGGSEKRKQKGVTGINRGQETPGGCDPNSAVFNNDGDRRHREAEAIARSDGDQFFENMMSAHPAPGAPANPNHVGNTDKRGKLSRKATAEYSLPDHHGSCNPNSLTAVTKSDSLHLHGPAGPSGVFSPGLSGPNLSSCHTPRQQAATANPNLSEDQPPQQRISRKHGVQSETAQDPQSPRVLGKRRTPSHPACKDTNVASLLTME